MTVELSGREIELLAVLIERRLHELGPEIHHTDSRPYRHVLAQQQEVLEGLQKRLAASAVSTDVRPAI
jgi:hypothetical protein